ncbi:MULTISPECIES: hypothetical protein [unclassified Methylobacterium]|uniref:DUF6197 family protein n=1 Tax=unclassified Methylobacterium TaxID=2615210 RepID=UPI0011C1ED83|nr:MULTISPECIES: hypothetical protein [unclassified Methylobacterium]QEE37892.1 hypothetical protein FVA80_01895 [Methylobacterium sp. WL1]TXN59402.1 hypothetical protein FV241_02515 [Methylobacterium sp. WL2]
MATALEPTLTSVLIATADQLANPAAWSRRAGARDALGNRVDPCSPAAVSWCLWGALESQLGRIAYEPDRYALTLAIEGHLLAIARYTLDLPELDSLSQFSDDRSTTHQDILELLDEAANSLMRRQPASAMRSTRSMNEARA